MQVLYETSLADYLCYKVTAPVVVHKKHLTRICLSAKITHSCASQMRGEFCPLCWSSFPKGRSTPVLPPSFTDLETTSKELHWSSAALSRNEEIPNALLGGDSSLSAMHFFHGPGRDPVSVCLQMISLPARPPVSKTIYHFGPNKEHFVDFSWENNKKKTLRIAWIFW